MNENNSGTMGLGDGVMEVMDQSHPAESEPLRSVLGRNEAVSDV